MTETVVQSSGCGAPAQDAPTSADLNNQTVITGTVNASDGEAVAGAYVRLLDSGGEFVAEVVSGQSGAFRFFAAEGKWTLRVLSRAGNGETGVAATVGLNEAQVTVTR